ncbi:hypothetical protein DY000_02035613 [Brassica cretica]|uniref:Transmembrane protein n=1 Tax=Brassica cretica TaxID=69181 RepID=A0ABQ7DKB0_BRACR|nr:hypothetical protein DY000_02035613 [Brassica cretica]
MSLGQAAAPPSLSGSHRASPGGRRVSFSVFFLRLSLFVGPRRSPASEARPSFASGVDLESSLHLGQSVVCGSARGRVAALRNPIYSWCAPSVWLRSGGGVTVGQCRVGLEDSRISSSLSPPSASDRWWARVGATMLVSPACSVATCVGMAARVAARVASLILFSLRFNAVTPGHRFLLLLVSEVPLMLFTLNKQLENRTVHSSAVCFRRVSYLAVCFLYMSSRFNGCIRSRRDEMETANFRFSLRTTASSLGGSLSCCRRYLCRVVWMCFRAWILCPFQVWVVFSEAAEAIASRFEGAFLSVAHGARYSTSIWLGFFGLSSSRCLASQ